LVVLALFMVIIAAKLADLQVMRPTDYRELSIDQRVVQQTLPADRGTIFDRNGVELAVSVPTSAIFVDPKLVEDPAAEAAQLADVLGLDAATIEAAMSAPNRFGYVARQVDDETRAKVEALDLPGVAFLTEPKRITPNGELARSVIGQVDTDGVGYLGLEKVFGEQLTGEPGRLSLERAPDGRTIPVGEHHLIPAVAGDDLVLTLDRSLQFEAERILAASVVESKARGAMAVVSRPDTGEILALVNVSADDETGAVRVNHNNASLTEVYEPGSVMKIVAAAAAIEEGLVEPDSLVVVPDTITLGGAVFSEHDYHGTVSWPVSRIISESSNVGTIKLGQMLGNQRLYDYLRTFGFGERTALDFPDEQSGQLADPADWWGSSIGSIPIGQGVSVTPVQMLLAYNTIANGGVYVPPRLVQSTIEPDGTKHPFSPADPRRVVSEDTADKMNLMLRGVVTGGTGTKASVEGYTVAGKTGTARKPQPSGGYTDANGIMQYQGTFVGFVPAEAPTISIIVVIDEPRAGSIFGGQTAAPAFARIAELALRRYDVRPPASDRSARLASTIPEDPRARPTGGAASSALPRTADGRVRALPVGATPPGAGGASTATANASTPTATVPTPTTSAPSAVAGAGTSAGGQP